MRATLTLKAQEKAMRQEDFDRDWVAASKELLTGMKAWRLAILKRR
jgi:hypothetical protein